MLSIREFCLATSTIDLTVTARVFLGLDVAEMHLRLKNIFSSVFISSVTAKPLMRFAILNLTRAVANDTKKTQQAQKI